MSFLLNKNSIGKIYPLTLLIIQQVCVFTQGDPNTLNISISPCLFDLETAGYNSVM